MAGDLRGIEFGGIAEGKIVSNVTFEARGEGEHTISEVLCVQT